MKSPKKMFSVDGPISLQRQGLLLFFVCCFCQLHAQLPQPVQQLIETSIKNWNSSYGNDVKAVSWTYEGMIATETQRQDAIREITDSSKAWIPTGDISMPSSVSADRVINDTSVTSMDIVNWKTAVDGLILIGLHKVRVKWMKNSQAFTSLCIVNDTMVVYDNMITNIRLINNKVTNFTSQSKLCEDLQILWIWGSESGRFTATLVTNCDATGKVLTCDSKCEAYLNLGSISKACQVQKVGDNCCQLQWAYGWATGFKSIKLKTGKLEFEAEGYFGSNGEGSGSCTDCCTPTNASVPPIININSVCQSGQARISWETISVVPFQKFTVESSTDGIIWNTVVNMDAGNSSSMVTNYAITDAGANTKNNFYRVVATKLDGNKVYSSITGSPCVAEPNISVRPNPVSNDMIISIPSYKTIDIDLTVSNSQGLVVLRQQANLHIGKNEIRINLNNVSPGIYTLTAKSGGRFFKATKILKTGK